jgi:protection of telomeres protein 1
VKAIDPDRQPTPISEILKNIGRIARSDVEFDLPFTNVKYKSNLRVIDFWPDKLEDFSVGRRVSEYDVLSDFSGNESTDNEECMRQFRAGKGWGGEKVWEWRFALRVVDAGRKPAKENESIWLTVDNQAAQMLLNLDAVKFVTLPTDNNPRF